MKVSIGQLAEETGVSIDTLRRWEREGKITSERTEGGHRRYDLSKIKVQLGRMRPPTDKMTVGYARVSTPTKKEDLERQKQVIELFCASKGWKHTILTDVGSGLNYNKKGLKELLQRIEQNEVERLVLNYKDRLLRFGAELVFTLCELQGVEVVIIHKGEQPTFEEELAQDVLEIITVFSARLYGSRSKKHKNMMKALEDAARTSD